MDKDIWQEEKKEEKTSTEKVEKPKKAYDPETDYCCRLEGTELKFI